MDAAQRKRVARTRRHRRIRKHLAGTPQRPRLVVYRSNARMYAQVVDDTAGRTLVAASTLDADLRTPSEGGKVAAARAVGGLLAERAKAAGIEQVVFDRGGNQYHGRVAALAEGAREGGLTL